MNVSFDKLPKILQLKIKCYYRQCDVVRIEVSETFDYMMVGSQGRRGVVVLLRGSDYASFDVYRGSWSGPNMFSPDSKVDMDSSEYSTSSDKCSDGLVVLKGYEGHKPYLYRIIVGEKHPLAKLAREQMPKEGMLEVYADKAMEEGWSSLARLGFILNGIGAYKAKYRRQVFENVLRGQPDKKELDALVELHLIKINKAGHMRRTALGDNMVSELKQKGWTFREWTILFCGNVKTEESR